MSALLTSETVSGATGPSRSLRNPQQVDHEDEGAPGERVSSPGRPVGEVRWDDEPTVPTFIPGIPSCQPATSPRKGKLIDSPRLQLESNSSPVSRSTPTLGEHHPRMNATEAMRGDAVPPKMNSVGCSGPPLPQLSTGNRMARRSGDGRNFN